MVVKRRVLPEGRKLFKHQKEGIRFIVSRRRTLLADDMGLGKTCQMIVASNIWDTKLIVIVCPASLCINWKREFKKWDVKGRRVCIVGVDEWNGEDVLVCSDHIVTLKKLLAILDTHFKGYLLCLFVDEAHRHNKWDSQRNNVVAFNLLNRAEYFVAATGTPMHNGKIENLHPLVSMCAPRVFGGFNTFCEKYSTPVFDGYKVNYEGVRNTKTLKNHLSKFMLRRFKKDVLKDLPPVIKGIHEVEVEGSVAKRSLEYASYVDKLLNGEIGEPPPAMEEVWKELSKEKIPQVLEFIELQWDGGSGPIIVFAHHREVVQEIYLKLLERGMRVARLWGGDSSTRKQETVDKFQNHEVDILVLSITSMSLGLNLTASSCVIFAELHHVPGEVSQAIDRCHRIGAEKCVNVYFVVASKSLDVKMVKSLSSKNRNIQAVVGVGHE